MSLVHVFGLCVRVESHDLDPVPVPSVATPALWVLLAGLLVYLFTLGEDRLVAALVPVSGVAWLSYCYPRPKTCFSPD